MIIDLETLLLKKLETELDFNKIETITLILNKFNQKREVKHVKNTRKTKSSN